MAVGSGTIQLKLDGNDIGSGINLDTHGGASGNGVPVTGGDHILKVIFTNSDPNGPSGSQEFPFTVAGSGGGTATITATITVNGNQFDWQVFVSVN